MTPVLQSVTLQAGHDYGTCRSAAIASVLGLPERAVPEFSNPARFLRASGPDGSTTDLLDVAYRGAMVLGYYAEQVWARWMGYEWRETYDPAGLTQPFAVASGLGPRPHPRTGDAVHHAVVYARQADGTYALAHDPHPDGGGLVGEPVRYTEFVPAADGVDGRVQPGGS